MQHKRTVWVVMKEVPTGAFDGTVYQTVAGIFDTEAKAEACANQINEEQYAFAWNVGEMEVK